MGYEHTVFSTILGRTDLLNRYPLFKKPYKIGDKNHGLRGNLPGSTRERFLEELMEFLCIPSISALPAHMADVQQAAQWLEACMKAAGMEAVWIMPTGGLR